MAAVDTTLLRDRLARKLEFYDRFCEAAHECGYAVTDDLAELFDEAAAHLATVTDADSAVRCADAIEAMRAEWESATC